MHARNRITAEMIVASLVVAIPLSAFADDRRTTDKATVRAVEVADRPVDVARDHRVDRVTDRPNDEVVDRPRHRPTDEITDRPVDRCDHRRFAAAHERCVDDHRDHDVNIRKLLHRLFHAGEWAELVRLLHRLGWI